MRLFWGDGVHLCCSFLMLDQVYSNSVELKYCIYKKLELSYQKLFLIPPEACLRTSLGTHT